VALSAVQSEMIVHKASGAKAKFHRTDHIPTTLPERSVTEDLIDNISTYDVFYDLGANRGLYTCLAGDIVVDGEVHAFEPNPVAVSNLEQNIQYNDLSARVTVHQKAVSDNGEEIPFLVRSDSTGNTLQTTTVDEEDGETITVESINLDDFIVENDLPKPEIMKIDIEGAEVDALKSMRKSLEDCRIVYCEVHKGMIDGSDPELPAALLRDHGFTQISRIYERSDSHYFIRAQQK
jgi:FkbM family methyltransferase